MIDYRVYVRRSPQKSKVRSECAQIKNIGLTWEEHDFQRAACHNQKFDKTRTRYTSGTSTGDLWEEVTRTQTLMFGGLKGLVEVAVTNKAQNKFWGSSGIRALEFFLGFICNCLSYFITARITFTSILYPQCSHMLFIIYTLKKN